MDIGLPREASHVERRVLLTPAGVQRLVRQGHRVYVQSDAGRGARFDDEAYRQAGAQLVYEAEEVYGRARLILKVSAPGAREYDFLRNEQILMCFLHPVVAPPEGFQALLERRVAAVALELIEDGSGRAPVLESVSEIAGPMAIQIAAHLLESESEGRGILLGGAPGIPPATVVIIGAGVSGTAAARAALGAGAQVTLLDHDLAQLRQAHRLFGHRVLTLIADQYNISRATQFADVLIGAVLVRGDRAPTLVSEAMVRAMKPGSVIVDLSIDQGGCVETIRPTTLVQPKFVHHGVVHYAVPNLTASVARTASYALANACLPLVRTIAAAGLRQACIENAGLRRGLVVAAGACLHPIVADHFGVRPSDPEQVLGELSR